jgi:hypothetical protein
MQYVKCQSESEKNYVVSVVLLGHDCNLEDRCRYFGGTLSSE